MDADEHKDKTLENLPKRIDLTLLRAQAKTKTLTKSLNWFIGSSFVATAISTILAFSVAIFGQKAILGIFGVGQQSNDNENWKIICGIIGGLNVLAIFFANSLKALLVSDKLAQAVASEGNLAALQERLKYFDGKPEDIAREYEKVIEKDPELVREESFLPISNQNSV